MRTCRHLPLAAALVYSVATPASATITETMGGPGGREYSIRCPAGSAAVGITARAGAWVDGMTLLCASIRSGRRTPATWLGGHRSSPQEIYCPSNSFLTAVSMTFTRGQNLKREYVDAIGISCGAQHPDYACVTSGDGCTSRVIIPPGELKYRIDADRLACPPDEVVVGLVGRAGKYVDAVGLICGPNPFSVGSSLNEAPAAAALPPRETPNSIDVEHPDGRAGSTNPPTSTSPAGPGSTLSFPPPPPEKLQRPFFKK
jgi:hypothetical protein